MWAGRVVGWAALLAALLAAAGALLPLQPASIREGFYAALQFAAANPGAQTISTFGPLGFVFYPVYFPATFVWLLALRAALAAATCWTLAWLGYAAWGGPWGAALAVAGCAPFFASPDVWFLILPLLAALIELPARRAPLSLRLTLGAAIGVTSLIKFSFFLSAVAVLGPLTSAALLARRRVPAQTTAAVATAGLAWIATGHGWVDWLSYLDLSVREIAPGYSGAMQIPADARLTWHAVAVSAALLAAGLLVAWQRLRWSGWPVAVALAAVLALLFKAGFVRADVHVFITCFGLLVVAGLLAILWSRQPRRAVVAALLLALGPGSLWRHAVDVLGPPTLYFPPIFPPVALRRLVRAPAALGHDVLAAAHARAVADIRGATPPPPHGSIDVYPDNQEVLVAYDGDYRPRPVFESYMAYTPRLAQLNAAALVGERSPQWILFRVAPIDGRFPTLDDAPSWPILLARYDFVRTLGRFALLQRRPMPLGWGLQPIGHVATQTGAPVAVPAEATGPIWARIDVRETWRDALERTVSAAPLRWIALTCRDGQTRSYRLVSALTRGGFLLSPLVATTGDFIELAQRHDAPLAHQVTSLAITHSGFEARAVEVDFFRLVIEDQRADGGP